jgi:hypothetical protein
MVSRSDSIESMPLRHTQAAGQMSSPFHTFTGIINHSSGNGAMKLDILGGSSRSSATHLGPDPDDGEPPNHDNCNGRHDQIDSTISLSSTSRMADQSVAPFLAKHIPQQYAPLGVQAKDDSSTQKDPSSKFCYRHRPDVKCRRTADEPTMDNLQRVSSLDMHCVEPY